MEGPLLTSSLTVDIAIFVLLAAMFTVYTAFRSTRLFRLFSFALPIAGLLFFFFPYISDVSALMPPSLTQSSHIIVFLILLVAVLWLLQKNMGATTGSMRPMHIVVSSVMLAVLFISFTYHIIPIDEFYDFGTLFDEIFAPTAHFFWFIIISLLMPLFW